MERTGEEDGVGGEDGEAEVEAEEEEEEEGEGGREERKTQMGDRPKLSPTSNLVPELGGDRTTGQ